MNPPTLPFSIGRCSAVRLRGSVLVGVLIAMLVVSLAVMAAVTTGSMANQSAILSLQGMRSTYAAEAAAEMSLKELMDNVDHDGDGGIGSISDDGNTANDPQFHSARAYAQRSVSGSTTTITARGELGTGGKAMELVLTNTGNVVAGTVLMVVNNTAVPDAEEIAKRALIEGWGYNVTLIGATSSQTSFDTAMRSASVVYVCETVLSADVGTKLTNATLGVITEESSLSDELGISSGMTTWTGSTIDITNTTHYITKTLPGGTQSIFTGSQPLRVLSGTLGSFTTLGRQPSTSNPTLAVMERGATLTPSGTAAGRRVYLPFGNTGMSTSALTSAGQTIMRRSIEWCIMPVAQYQLDESSGTTAVDAIGGLNGTRSGGTWSTGRIGNAAMFNGSTDSLTIANNSVFQMTTAITIAGWIRATTWPADTNWASIIMRKGDANPNNWQLCVSAGRVVLTLDDYEAYGYRGNTTLPLNTWHHVAATWDGSHVRIYVNGALDAGPFTRTGTIGTDTRSVFIGGRSGATDVVAGSVDDVRLYSRALTAAEIASLASGGRPLISRWTSIEK